MDDSDDPISQTPAKFKDPSLEDPDLMDMVPMKISQRILLPQCPAYKCHIRTRTRVIVERNVAIQPSGTGILPFSLAQVSISTEDYDSEENKDEVKDRFIDDTVFMDHFNDYDQETAFSRDYKSSACKPSRLSRSSPATSATITSPSS